MDTNGNEFFTEKQKNLIRKLKHDKLKRINILYGSVRSGKTWITLVVFAIWVASMPKDKTYLMCAKTLTSLKRNCLDVLQEIVGDNYFYYSLSTKTAYLFGRKVYLEGANDVRSESKIRGMTLQGAYIDEITLVEKDFFTMLLSRLSEHGAKLFGSTNPDAPSHWLKKDYIDRADELDMYVDKFIIDDNTFLDEEYVEQIKKEYVGVFYDRFILGNFILAEGLIYPMYQDALVDSLPDNEVKSDCVSIDYGTMNAFAMIYWEKHSNGIWYGSKRYYYSGRDEGVQKTDNEYLEEIEKVLADRIKIYETDPFFPKLEVIIDPSAASFIALLKKTKWAKVKKADNAVLDGIRETASCIKNGRIKVLKTIKEWQDEAEGYVWDDSETEDKPVKVKDHCLTGDTLVMTEDGEKKISDLVGKSGKVLSFNTSTKKVELKPFFDCKRTQIQVETIEIKTDSSTIHCTPDHLILTTDGWIEARKCFRHKIININKKYENVIDVKFFGYADVYNMEVQDNHNFSVNGGLIVHNCMDATRYFVKTKNLAKEKRDLDDYYRDRNKRRLGVEQ